MPLADYAIPAAFNALDDTPFDDGHPVSSWAAREILHNDRLLHATLDACLMAKAWDLAHPWIFKGMHWVRLASWSGRITAGRRTLTVRLRGVVTNGLPAWFAVTSRQGGPFHAAINAGRWTSTVGTGAAANWQVGGVEVLGGSAETIEVFCSGGVASSAAADVTGAITDVEGPTLRSAAAFVGAMAEGWVIRLEDAGSGQPLTEWRTIVNFVSASIVVVWPAWDRWSDIPSEQYVSGAVNFRAREAASVSMRSLAIDEDALTGELGE